MNLNWKLATAFATGAVLASGIVYFAVQQLDNVEPPRPVSIAKTSVPPLPVPPPPAPQSPAAPLPKVAAAPVIRPTPVREKRSPMPPPVRHERPVAIARYEPPPAPPPTTRPVPVVAPEPPPPAPTPVAPSVPVQNVSLPAPNVQTRVPNTVTLAEGTLLAVRVGGKHFRRRAIRPATLSLRRSPNRL